MNSVIVNFRLKQTFPLSETLFIKTNVFFAGYNNPVNNKLLDNTIAEN